MRPLFILLVIAGCGLLFAGWTVASGAKKPMVVAPVVEPASSPYTQAVAGAGLVEPASEVIAIGSPLGEVIAKVAVTPGVRVNAGDALIHLDDRVIRAQEAVGLAAVNAANAALRAAHTVLDEASEQASRAGSDLLSGEENSRRTFAVANTKARVAQAEADVAQAQASLAATRVELERRIIRAPVAGTVLRVDARAGEFAPSGRFDPPLMTIGDIDHLRIRVDVDENDAWRIVPGSTAVGTVRGNPALKTGLRFLRIEPYVVPKKSLTGASSERVDTRVLQLIYEVERTDLRLYAGQQMDVFIEAGKGNQP